MKELSFISICLLSYVSVWAQPVLTSESFYTTGDNVVAYDVVTTNLEDGTDGPQQIWNFSQLPTVQESAHWGGNIVDPESLSDFDFYNGANIAMVMNDGAIRYWKSNEQELAAIGQGGDQNLLQLTNSNKLLEFPFTMGSSFSDEASGMLYSACRTYEWQSSSETQGVGYGTLMLPSGTYDNVLKVRRISFTAKTETEHGFERENNIVEHYWFQPGTPGPLFYMRSWSNNGCPGSNEGTEAFYTVNQNISTGTFTTAEGEFSLSLFPNPATAKTHLSVQSDKNMTGKIWISDLLGKNVVDVNASGEIEKSKIYNIDLSHLQPGMYVLNLRTREVHTTRKLIVQ